MTCWPSVTLIPRWKMPTSWDWPLQEQRLVITMKDFGELVYRSGQAHAGALLLRLENADSQTKVSVVSAIYSEHDRYGQDVPAGAAVRASNWC